MLGEPLGLSFALFVERDVQGALDESFVVTSQSASSIISRGWAY